MGLPEGLMVTVTCPKKPVHLKRQSLAYLSRLGFPQVGIRDSYGESPRELKGAEP
jgi:hypothetical protein